MFTLNIQHHGAFVYRRCPPFQLEADECSSWLTWEILPIPDISHGIQMLQVKAGKDPEDLDNRTGICSLLQFSLYSRQITHLPPPLQHLSAESSANVAQYTPTRLEEHQVTNDLSNSPGSLSVTTDCDPKCCCSCFLCGN